MASTPVSGQVAAFDEGYPTHRRKVEFDWSNTPLHWVPGDPFTTHMINVLHLLLPTGERWFIEAVKDAEPLVTDPEIKAAIKPFVQQESWHALAHTMVLRHLADQGIDTSAYIDRLDRWLSALSDRHERWPNRLRRWWLYRHLADTAALEHFTAVLGQWVIQTHGLDYAGADPTMLDLLRWHACEEVEHRSVVFDIYQHVCGSYLLRALSMLLTAPQFVFWWLAGARYLMRHDPTHPGKPTWRAWLRASRDYRTPGPWKLIVTTPLRYLRPGHHPKTEGNTAMALEYLQHSPAAKAAREHAEAHPADSEK
jgi:predicted metal-dependent hydrolase